MKNNIFIRKAVLPLGIVILCIFAFMIISIITNKIPDYIEELVFIMLIAVMPLISNNYSINSIVVKSDYDNTDLERDKNQVKTSIYMTILIYLIIAIINLVIIWKSISENSYIYFIFLIITIVIQIYCFIKYYFSISSFFAHYYELGIRNKIIKRLPYYIVLYIFTYLVGISLPLISTIF